MAPPYEFLDHPGPIAFAHRGGAGPWPENTWPAFEHAVSLGYRYLETDVHCTADGVVIAFHDHELDRVTDRRGAIARLSWADVRRARVGGTHEIARLDELLDAFPDRRFNIDPKHDGVVGALAKVLTNAGAVDRVCIGSFREARLNRLRKLLGPRLCTSTGPAGLARLRLAAAGVRCPLPRVPCAQAPTQYRNVTMVNEQFVRVAHRAGVAVHVWTINDAPAMRRLLDLGVDGIMTDEPEILRDVLISRGEWHA